jgi:Protein phosphatase 2C
MNVSRWTWAAARSVGTSHLKVGKGCDDFAACLEFRTESGPLLVAVASDGAGSAPHSALGAWITTRVFVEQARRYIKAGQPLRLFTVDTANEWLDEIRDRIIAAASNKSTLPRDFAATLVGSLISGQEAIFVHVRDGAAVFRVAETPEWHVASWPAQGEYASTTYFVTDDPQPSIQFSFIERPISELAIFSDGLERLVLDFSSHTAHAPFFDKMFAPLTNVKSGKHRKLSRGLRQFLDSPSVCDKTDDDKTLILAKRIRNC